MAIRTQDGTDRRVQVFGALRPGTTVPVATVAVLAVAIAGSYGFGWTWTGFAGNDLWDYLHLLVLPVALAGLPLWLRTHDRFRPEWQAAAAAALVALAVLVVGGYRLGWGWTGFTGNALWDWLELLVLPLTVAMLPLWLDLERRAGRRVRLAWAAAAVAFGVAVAGGYAGGWEWTGFRGNTLWDWVGLLIVPFVVPVAVTVLIRRIEAAERRPLPPA